VDRAAPDPPRPFAVVLAAGASSRMGRPKALLPLAGRTVIEAHLTRLAAHCGELVVVLGAHASAIRAVLPAGVRIVYNPDWADTHPVDSLRRALRVVEAPHGLVVPVDTPPARPRTLERLLGARPPAVPVDAAGRRGHPVAVGSAIVAAVRDGPVPGGLRTLLTEAREVPVDDPWVGFDFDEPSAWARFVEEWDG